MPHWLVFEALLCVTYNNENMQLSVYLETDTTKDLILNTTHQLIAKINTIFGTCVMCTVTHTLLSLDEIFNRQTRQPQKMTGKRSTHCADLIAFTDLAQLEAIKSKLNTKQRT